jgi:hypothetical protein
LLTRFSNNSAWYFIVVVDIYPDLVSFFAFQLSLELQQVQQNMDEQALLSKAVVEHLQKSVTKLEEEKFEMQVFSLCVKKC